MAVKTAKQINRERISIYGPAILLSLIGFTVAYKFVNPAPPDHISMGIGQPEGTYCVLGKAYHKILARDKIKIDLRATTGSIENIHLLQTDADGVDVAFIQGGTGGSVAADQFISLGSLYYESGPPFLQRYLPFWAATLVDRLKVMLVPLLALFLPLFRIMPPLYRWRVRSRIYSWYSELDNVDPESHHNLSREQLKEYLTELKRIEDEVIKVTIPLSYSVELYELRLHVEYLRYKLGQIQASVGEG